MKIHKKNEREKKKKAPHSDQQAKIWWFGSVCVSFSLRLFLSLIVIRFYSVVVIVPHRKPQYLDYENVYLIRGEVTIIHNSEWNIPKEFV